MVSGDHSCESHQSAPMASGIPGGHPLEAVEDENGYPTISDADRHPIAVQHPTGGSFAERLAARAAADKGQTSPLKVTSARFKAVPPSRIMTPQAKPGTCLTIPQGMSPAALLESPVLLSTNQAEPSPTTGSFPYPLLNGRGTWAMGSSETAKEPGGAAEESNGRPAFVFKPCSLTPQRMEPGQMSPLGGAGRFGQLLARASRSAEEMRQTDSQQGATGEDDGRHTPPLIEKPAEDGYNWRKYGQKQVKGSEHPRSYYKCTHPGCSVKKKVERSEDGHVTERVYKGTHNHPQPTPTRRVSVLHALGGGNRYISELARALANGQGFAVANGGGGEQGNGQAGAGLGRQRMGSGAPGEPGQTGGGVGNGSRAKQCSGSEEQDGDQASGSSDDSGDEEEHRHKHGAEEDGQEPDGKRRRLDRKDGTASLTLSQQRGGREPRLVIQATSEVEILDDGYRWRKYGQKVVKGNPHPRSYYKCTSVGCPVRKHVERSSTDPKEVITTYEGKHNHDVPAMRGVKEDRDKDAMSTPGSGISTSNVSGLPTPMSAASEHTPTFGTEPTSYGKMLEGDAEDAEREARDDGAGVGLADREGGSSLRPCSTSAQQPGLLLLDSALPVENGRAQPASSSGPPTSCGMLSVVKTEMPG